MDHLVRDIMGLATDRDLDRPLAQQIGGAGSRPLSEASLFRMGGDAAPPPHLAVKNVIPKVTPTQTVE